MEICVACQIIASWPFVINWWHKTQIKNMKYIMYCVFKSFVNMYLDEYELKEDDNFFQLAWVHNFLQSKKYIS